MSGVTEVNGKCLHDAIQILAANVSPSGIPDETVERFVFQNPVEAGRRFGEWLRSGCRLLFEPKVLILPPHRTFGPNGSESFFPGFEPGWSDWLGPIKGNGLEGEEARDLREDTLGQVCFEQVVINAWLTDGDTEIPGEEVLSRIKALGHICLGGLTLSGLWQDYFDNYYSIRGNSILEWLFRNHGVRKLNFLGLIRRSPKGFPYIPFLYRGGIDHWHPDIRSLRGAFSKDEHSVSLPPISG